MENVYNNIGGSGIFVQVGAGAGDLDTKAGCRDGFTEFIKKLPRDRVKRILLVEPNPINIPLLRECWKDYPEAEIYEIAIVPSTIKNPYMDLYYTTDDYPHCQVASINKQHVRKHYRNSEISSVSVPTRHIQSFIQETVNGAEVELLALDIEGIDAEVILDVDRKLIPFKYISFEHLHLDHDEDSVNEHLSKQELMFLGKGVDHNGFDHLWGATA